MKVLWVGDAVSATGFARCTHAVCDKLHSLGHEVVVLGLNYYGDPHRYKYPIHACYNPSDGCHDVFGIDRLPKMIDRLEPDIVVILNDPWNVPAYLESISECQHGIKIVGWLAVDSDNHPEARHLNNLERIVTWTHYGKEQIQKGGYSGPCDVVPLGVDHDTFYLHDKSESRLRVLPKEVSVDSFIVGSVARNHPRKRLDLTVQYFSEWLEHTDLDDVYLYLHVMSTGFDYDLRSLIRYFGVENKVIINQPRTDYGVRDVEMPYIYSAFDVFLCTSQGEGWGLPVLEAMACGVPCIVPDFAALSEWPEDAAFRVGCNSRCVNAPIGKSFTVGAIPDCDGVVDSIRQVTEDEETRDFCKEAGVKVASKFSWDRTAMEFVSILESL